MKIGIITVQKSPNFGAQLQCYALWKAVRDLGHQCEVIDLCRPYHDDFIESRGYKSYRNPGKSTAHRLWESMRPVWSWIKEHILKRPNKAKDFAKKYKPLLLSRAQKFAKFESRISFSRKYRSIKELYKDPPQYDIYMTGSDQLWNPTQPYCLEPYFLTFVNNGGRRVSYATSIGISSIRDEVATDFKKWLVGYDRITVREPEAKRLLQPLTDKEIDVLADPTFLIDIYHWKEMAVRPSETGYVFLFTLGYNEMLYDKAHQYAKSVGKKLVYRASDHRDYPSRTGATAILDMSPEEWLGYILYSDMVITNSFHGCVFSIILHKQFRVTSTTNRGSRIFHLLDLFACKAAYMEVEEAVSPASIDFCVVDNLIKNERDKALHYLNSLQ